MIRKITKLIKLNRGAMILESIIAVGVLSIGGYYLTVVLDDMEYTSNRGEYIRSKAELEESLKLYFSIPSNCRRFFFDALSQPTDDSLLSSGDVIVEGGGGESSSASLEDLSEELELIFDDYEYGEVTKIQIKQFDPGYTWADQPEDDNFRYKNDIGDDSVFMTNFIFHIKNSDEMNKHKGIEKGTTVGRDLTLSFIGRVWKDDGRREFLGCYATESAFVQKASELCQNLGGISYFDGCRMPIYNEGEDLASYPVDNQTEPDYVAEAESLNTIPLYTAFCLMDVMTVAIRAREGLEPIKDPRDPSGPPLAPGRDTEHAVTMFCQEPFTSGAYDEDNKENIFGMTKDQNVDNSVILDRVKTTPDPPSS